MNSPIKWVGGKRNLLKTIIPLIPEHHCYIEPFAGAGWVFFKKDKSKVEVINDIDKNLITFYSVLKNNYNNFIEKLDTYLVSRDEFDYLKSLKVEELNDVMNAYRFYYLNKNSFGGAMTSFNSYYRDKPYMNDKSIQLLHKVHKRLKDVWIENQDYKQIINKFDKNNSFFYLDPPYYETNNSSYKFGQNINFKELKNILYNIKGKFMLSINNNEYIEKLFGNFNIKNIDVQYNISKETEGRKKYKELIITNY